MLFPASLFNPLYDIEQQVEYRDYERSIHECRHKPARSRIKNKIPIGTILIMKDTTRVFDPLPYQNN